MYPGIRHRYSVYADRNLLSVSWPKQPPEFAERPGLRGPQPARIKYRGFYLPPSINRITGTVCYAIGLGHRNPVYADRNLLSVSWPKQPPEFAERLGLRGPQPARIEYRGFYLPPTISSSTGTVRCAIGLGHRNPVYADRNLLSVSWPN
jgi:hypothetical protein